jgi:hypothetical protein
MTRIFQRIDAGSGRKARSEAGAFKFGVAL